MLCLAVCQHPGDSRGAGPPDHPERAGKGRLAVKRFLAKGWAGGNAAWLWET